MKLTYQFLPGLFEARCRMSESGFETYLIIKYGKRWEVKNKIEKVEMKLKYMLSDDNNARFGKYLTSLSSPSDILNCEWGVKELSSLEDEVLKKKVSAEESHVEQFSDNGQIYDWNEEKKEYLEIRKIYLAMKLLTPLKLLYKKRLTPPLANLK